MTMASLTLTGEDLTLADVENFTQGKCQVTLADSTQEPMATSVAAVDHVIETGRASYGINTGFGALARQRISRSDLVQLQYNLIRSHSCGVGDPLPESITRRLMLLKANNLSAGFSGIRRSVVESLLALLNAGVTPVIPSRGSVGASGDLAPLAHLALTLIGEGEAHQDGKLLQGAKVLQAAGCEPVQLQAKEGLALLNGTQLSAAMAMEGLFSADRLLRTSIVTGALTVEALAGSYSPFDERIHTVRRMPGQIKVAQQFRSLLTGSEIWESHQGCDRVQDPYALRCMPQVYGAVWDTLKHAAELLQLECNSVSDNPLIFGGDIISGGNFHAEPLAFLSDFMAIAVCELGSISERRIDLLLKKINPHLNMFLAAAPGLESGYMIAHVSAAALASENKTLAHPASVDSIPTSAGQEDHVSMAPWAGFKLQQIISNVQCILAIELLTSGCAIDAQRPKQTTPELENLWQEIRKIVPVQSGDRRLDGDIRDLSSIIADGVVAKSLPDPAGLAIF